MTTPFHALPHDKRMALREVIEQAGGYISTYLGLYVLVAIPNPAGPFYTAMKKAGLVLDKKSLHYFPLGTDKPADHLRHDGHFPNSKSFWLFGRYSVADEPVDDLFHQKEGGHE